MKRIIYLFVLTAVIILFFTAIVYYGIYSASGIRIPEEISFSGALQWVIAGGYALILIGMFVFGPIIISAGAFAAALGYLNVWLVFAIAVIWEIVVDLAFYAAGYFGRLAIIEKYVRFFGLAKEKMEKLEKLIHAHPIKTLTFIKLAPVLPLPGLILVGFTHMPVKRYISINFIIALARAVIFTAIGYYFGQIYDSISRYIKNAEYILLLGIVLVAGIYYLYKKATDKITEKLEESL